MLTHIQNSFSSGELSPSVFGRTDLAKWHSGASTMRNFFVNYRGGAASRAGTSYVGMTKQGAPNAGGTATNNPPRDITFQFNIDQGYALEFGDKYMRVKSDGAYVTEASQNITGITQANPGVVTYNNSSYTLADVDWVFISNVGGVTELNGLTFIWRRLTATTGTLTDLFGNVINTNLYPAFTSGGTLSRIYTVVSPYAAIDLPYLKFTQSADTMSLCCVNQTTLTEYPPYDLERNGNTNWVFTQVTFASSITAPTGLSATANSSTTSDTFYSYAVTAVAADGEESIASSSVQVENNNISINAGSNVINWTAVSNASSYNVYGSTSNYQASVPVGALYGILGESLGTSFVDSNIEADFTHVPPVHQNPFARGALLNVNPISLGSGYTQTTTSATVSSTSGSGAIVDPIVNAAGGVSGYLVPNGGQSYSATTDSLVIFGSGTSASASLNIGPQTGTYPSTVAYFQQRRIYANTLNNPDTYYMSQPGAFLNMDSSIPSSDTDAIVGQPWSQQINGIQFMVPMPGGLVILTGSGAWQLTGGNNAAITPSSQVATPQAYNGCHNHIAPIVANYDILYVQSKGSIVRDLSYNFFVNIYTGTDTTVLSNQLFTNHQLQQWAYAEEPYKVIWAVRDDGVLLSFTYLKEQDVYGWARHDTNGLFVSVCSVTELPVDAVYAIVQRYVQGQWVYYSERMNNRTWANVEQAWCVDAGLSLPMTFPNATLYPAAANGTSNITSVLLPVGGKNYTAPIISAVDLSGTGAGATFGYTLSGGVITSIFPILTGQKYTPGQTEISIVDATGTGAQAYPVITNIVSFSASQSVFNAGMVGDVIRVGGGIADITSYVSGTQVMANIIQPITNTIPNDPNNTPVPATQNASNPSLQLPDSTWSISTPVSQVSGLNHLNGLQVTGLADGGIISPTIVQNGSISLPSPASAIVVGLPFIAQLQGMYADTPAPTTVQGKRKDIFGVTVRMEASRGMQIGTNQVDASTQPNGATVPWVGLFDFKERNATVHAGQPIQLFTGDEYIVPSGSWDEKGQISIQQSYPLPANVLAFVMWSQTGDSDG